MSKLVAVVTYPGMLSLQNVCQRFLVANADPLDYCMIFLFAQRFNLDAFASEVFELIKNNFSKIFAGNSFLELSLEQMADLLRSDDLSVENEDVCWHAAVNWYLHDAVNRESGLRELMALVRFPLMQISLLEQLWKRNVECETATDIAAPFLETAYSLLKNNKRSSFEISHPLYHLRNIGFKTGVLILNRRAPEPKFFIDETQRFAVPRFTNDQRHLIGLLDPESQQTQWFHEIPERFCPKFVALSKEGDLFITSTLGDCPPTATTRLIKYSNEFDQWEVLVENQFGLMKGMCVLNSHLYLLHSISLACLDHTITYLKCWRTSSFCASKDTPIFSGRVPFRFHPEQSKVVAHKGHIFTFNCASWSEFPDVGGDRTYRFDPKPFKWKEMSKCPVRLQIKAGNNKDNVMSWYPVAHGRAILRSYDPVSDTWQAHIGMQPMFNPYALCLWKEKLVIKSVIDPAKDPKRQHNPQSNDLTRSARPSEYSVSLFDPETKRSPLFRVPPYAAGVLPGGFAFRMRKCEAGSMGELFCFLILALMIAAALKDKMQDVRVVKISRVDLTPEHVLNVPP